jgi:drug/metabolite transporter (DMT)-like permease
MYQATFASLFFGIIPIALYATTQLHSWDISKTTHNSVLALIYSTIAIVVANAMFFYALQRKQVQTTGVYQYIQPIATIVAAWFILAERPSLKFVLGASLVFLGVYLAEAKLSRKVLLRHSG